MIFWIFQKIPKSPTPDPLQLLLVLFGTRVIFSAEYMGRLTNLVLPFRRCSLKTVTDCTFCIWRPRIAFIPGTALLNARTVDFLALYF